MNGRLASLSQFLPKLVEKAKSLYKLLKENEPFICDKAYKQAFLSFKKTIVTPPILSRPRPGAPLLLYLLVSNEVVSSPLVQEYMKHQLPIYFTNCILHNAEKQYQIIEKVVLELITSTRHLRPYFQSHHVVVKMNYPIR